ncbi:MAG: hypothetical protein IKC26_03000 [Clostridia bacterium]|nr:hypothetical protein [Clostridia bacterium]
MAETKTVFKDEGYDPGSGYTIWEYENGTPIYQYTGYYRGGDTMTLYPHHALVKGTVRGKRSIKVAELVRNRKKE